MTNIPGECCFIPPPNEEDEESNVPPLFTRTWFHTGFYMEGGKISQQYEQEYFSGDSQGWLLPDTTLPAGLAAKEIKEACRALKGSMLRQEVYARDGSAKNDIPYTVAEKSYSVRRIQPWDQNRHAVFHCQESETITYNYERVENDPRITHALVLETDSLGNVTKSATVAYPRRSVPTGLEEQGQLLIKYDENSFIDESQNSTFYRHSAPSEQKSFQIHGLTSNGKFSVDELLDSISGATEITNQTAPSLTVVNKRWLSHNRIYYYNEDCTQSLALGSIASHGLVYQTKTLALSGDCLENLYSFSNTGAENSLLPDDTGLASILSSNQYEYESASDGYWKTSQRKSHDPDHFFTVTGIYDPLSNFTEIVSDGYYLLPIKVTLPPLSNLFLGDTIEANNDYRILKPWHITDENGNYQCVAYDALGMIVKTWVSGKNSEGDTAVDPTTILSYSLNEWMDYRRPVYVHISARAVHQDSNTPWLESYTYSNGLGQQMPTKVQAEDGFAWHLDNNGQREWVQTTDRWVATGRAILNNKGNVVARQYEPWFSTTQ